VALSRLVIRGSEDDRCGTGARLHHGVVHLNTRQLSLF
jgi:hypothetical protein